jgi:hypothetical protein
MKRNEVLDSATKCVCGDREAQYGSPEDNFKAIADLWTVWCGYGFTAHDVAIMMSLMKVARLKTGTFKDDSYIDAVGYLACAGEISESRE